MTISSRTAHTATTASTSSEPQKAPSTSTLSYRHLSYSVRTTSGENKMLIDDISVDVRAGELLAIMGPSGAGKSTLLDVMAFRKDMKEGGSAYLNGVALTRASMHKVSNFVEQEDALLGVLTVRESITYALRLHLPLLPRKQVKARVDRVITALGLSSCAEQQIGTPISRGISGGQKRRVTAACAMVTFPRILLLDEVTSGLDSTSAREVIAAISRLTQAEGIIVLASIHQPSLETFSQFSNVILLSEGKTCYSGPVDELEAFFESWGHPVGRFITPADHAMNFLNTDFVRGSSDDEGTATMEKGPGQTNRIIDEFREFWLSRSGRTPLADPTALGNPDRNTTISRLDSSFDAGKAGLLGTLFWNTMVLSERSALNYSRNLLAYGVRIGMYAGMGFMLATIWIRLGTRDSTINDRLSVHFYSVAFLGFMSVAGIPAFLEERAVYLRESKNGLYTTLPFVLSNTLVNIPFLFVCTVVFTLICYWAIGLHPGAAAFFRFVGFLFLPLLVAESQAAVVASLLPVFVAALAIAAFLNGFWMSVGGYFIKARSLPRFWYFSFHFMDFQKYAFELLTNVRSECFLSRSELNISPVQSDFRGLNFSCETQPKKCTVSGENVLSYLEIGSISYEKWSGILISIFVIYRVG
ncbi:P-loop containing nucleoside triphosphate hydrolase protein [Panaeolus papilionaceus]|nr:P-loop containing nucleoside triphosphate hydrolase protein [Panaeolus papilionaceus]